MQDFTYFFAITLVIMLLIDYNKIEYCKIKEWGNIDECCRQ